MIAAVLAVPTHGIGGRQDLPIGYGLAVWGSGIAVAVSIALLLIAWRSSHFQTSRAALRLPQALSNVLLSTATRVTLGVVGTFAWLLAIVCGLVGTFRAADNFAPSYLYVLLWLGIIPLSLLFGPLYRWLNPARALHAALYKAAALDPQRGLRPLPEKLGIWPGLAGIGVYACLELTVQDPSRPMVVAAYLSFVLIASFWGGVLYGQEFFRWGDPFEAYARVLSAMSPTRVTEGRIEFVNPLRGIATMPRPAGLPAFIFLLIGSTAFDGLSRTSWFTRWTLPYSGRGWLIHDSVYLVGMILVIALFAGAVLAALRAYAKISATPWQGLVSRFAPTLIPIALGYAVAHYFSLLLFQSMAVPRLLADPAGVGWQLWNTDGWKVDFTIVKASTIALIQVGGIAAGHAISAAAAHDTALAVAPTHRKLIAQLPLALVMIAITTTATFVLLNDG